MARELTPEELEERISSNIEIITQSFEDEEHEIKTLKKIICPFFKGSPSCYGCSKKFDIITECRDLYVDRISIRPMQNWSPAFDEVTIREPKKVIANNTLLCDTCYLSDNCPQYQKRSTCSIMWGEDIAELDYKKQLDLLINLQHQRITIARAAELQDGGMPDGILSTEMDRLSNLIAQKKDADNTTFSMNIKASGAGSTETGGGILAKLFAPKQEALPEAQTTPISIPANIQEAEVIETSKKKRRET